VLVQTAPVGTHAQLLQIVPLGDSITQGVFSLQTYRCRLWQKLVDAGAPVTFVGSRTDNFEGSASYPNYRGLAFPRNHEGHAGWRAQDLLDGCTAADPCTTKNQGTLIQWLYGYRPDVVLIFAGTNDILQNNNLLYPALSAWFTIDILRTFNPDVKVLLGQITPLPGGDSKVRTVNTYYAIVAAIKSTPRSPVVLVDHYTGFNLATDTVDGIHPNPAGEEKIASRWLAALSSLYAVAGAPGAAARPSTQAPAPLEIPLRLVTHPVKGDLRVIFSASPDWLYTVEWAEDLSAPGGWQVLEKDLPGVAGDLVVIETPIRPITGSTGSGPFPLDRSRDQSHSSARFQDWLEEFSS